MQDTTVGLFKKFSSVRKCLPYYVEDKGMQSVNFEYTQMGEMDKIVLQVI